MKTHEAILAKDNLLWTHEGRDRILLMLLEARKLAVLEAAAIARQRFVPAKDQKDERGKGCNDAAHWISGRILAMLNDNVG